MILRIEIPDEIGAAIIRELGSDALNSRVVNALRDLAYTHEDPVKHLHDEGLSDAEIGLRLGIDASRAKYRRTKLGLPANPRRNHQHARRTAA